MTTPIQQNSAVVASTATPSITFDSTLTVGSKTYLFMVSQGDRAGITAPSGYTLLRTFATSAVTYAIAYKIADGTETGSGNWGQTVEQSRHNTLGYIEIAAVDVDSVVPITSGFNDDNGTLRTSVTATADDSTDSGDVGIFMFGAQRATETEGGRAYSDSYSEIEAGGLGTTRPMLGLALKDLTATGITECTYTTTGAGDECSAFIMVLAAPVASSGIAPLRRRIETRKNQ